MEIMCKCQTLCFTRQWNLYNKKSNIYKQMTPHVFILSDYSGSPSRQLAETVHFKANKDTVVNILYMDPTLCVHNKQHCGLAMNLFAVAHIPKQIKTPTILSQCTLKLTGSCKNTHREYQLLLKWSCENQQGGSIVEVNGNSEDDPLQG